MATDERDQPAEPETHTHGEGEPEHDHTPAEETEAAAEPVEPVPARHEGDRIDRLEGIVNGLVDIVAGLTPRDDRPTKLPWTHRLGRNDR